MGEGACASSPRRAVVHKYTFINKNTPLGVQEQSPDYALQNQQSYMLWDMLDNNMSATLL